MKFRLTLSHVSVDDDGARTETQYADSIPAHAEPLPPAVTADPESPVDASGYTVLVDRRTDIRLGDAAQLAEPDGTTESLNVERVSVEYGRRRNYSQIRLRKTA